MSIPRSSLERTTRSAFGSPTPSSTTPSSPVISAPIARSRSITARRLGLSPTSRIVRSASGWIARGDQPERRRGHVAGDAFIDCSHATPSFNAPGDAAARLILASDVDAACSQHPFRVIPRPHQFPNGGSALGAKRREQDRRLDLRARDRRLVVHGSERRVPDDGEWRQRVGSSGVQHRAHRAQGPDDTGHRTPSQRGVAVQDGVHRRAPRACPRRGACSSRSCRSRGSRPAPSSPSTPGESDAVVDRPAALALALDRDAERSDDARRRAHVCAVAGAGDPALALGERGEEQGAVADRLVAGQPQVAAQPRGAPHHGDVGAGPAGSARLDCRAHDDATPTSLWTSSCSGRRRAISDRNAVEGQLLRAVGERLVGSRVHLDHDPVGARRDAGHRQRRHERALARRVRRIGDHRQVAELRAAPGSPRRPSCCVWSSRRCGCRARTGSRWGCPS